MRHRRGVDLERRQRAPGSRAARCRTRSPAPALAAEDELAAGDRAAAGRRAATGMASRPGRRRPGRASRAARRTPRRACLRGTARADGSSARRRRRASRGIASRQASSCAARPRASSARPGSGARPAVGVGQPGRVEDARPGPTMRGGRAASTKPVRVGARAARAGSRTRRTRRGGPAPRRSGSGPARCGTRPVRRRRGRAAPASSRAAVAQRGGERVAGEATRVSRHDRLRRVPSCFDGCIDRARAACLHRLAGRWPRPTTATGTRRRAGSASWRRCRRCESSGPADDPGEADLLIALHARRSADVDAALARRPGRRRRWPWC